MVSDGGNIVKKLIIGLSIALFVLLLIPFISWLLTPNVTGTWYGGGPESEKILTLVVKDDGSYTGEGLMPGQWQLDGKTVKFFSQFGDAEYTIKNGVMVRVDNEFSYYRDKDTAEKMAKQQKADEQKAAFENMKNGIIGTWEINPDFIAFTDMRVEFSADGKYRQSECKQGESWVEKSVGKYELTDMYHIKLTDAQGVIRNETITFTRTQNNTLYFSGTRYAREGAK